MRLAERRFSVKVSGQESYKMPYDQIGRWLLIMGGVTVLLGLFFVVLGRMGLGKLPGDISFSTGNFTCFVPVASMLILSLLLTIILNVVLRIINK